MPDVAAQYRHARELAVLFDCSDRGKVEVTGQDAPTFLHNLCTNDVANLPLGGGCEAFFTTAKAKVVAHTLIFHVRLGDGRDAMWLDVAAGQVARLVAHLDHFLISERVEITDRTTDFAQFHLAGPRATTVLARALNDSVPDLAPLQHMERTFGSDATSHVRRNDVFGLIGYDIICLVDRGPEVWQHILAAGAVEADRETYEVLRIEAGTPEYGKDIDENRFAVEVGRTNAISYTKGCYLGQEPIVMARDRAGHVNRALRGIKFPNGAPTAGAKLFADGKEVGLVTSAAESPRLGPIGLGYLRRGHESPGTRLEVAAIGGQPAEVTDLPIA